MAHCGAELIERKTTVIMAKCIYIESAINEDFFSAEKGFKKGIIHKVNWIQVSMTKYLINGHSLCFSKFFLFPNIRTFCSSFPAYNRSRLKTRYKQISPFLEYFILCFQSLPNLPFLAIFPLDRFCLPWQRFYRQASGHTFDNGEKTTRQAWPWRRNVEKMARK